MIKLKEPIGDEQVVPPSGLIPEQDVPGSDEYDLTREQAAELDRRIEEEDRNPTKGFSIEEVRAHLRTLR